MKTCRYPGCTTPLYDRNTAGVCREHLHLRGHCECGQCMPGKEKPPPRRQKMEPEVIEQEEQALLVPDPDVATIEELCAPLSARVMSRNIYNWRASTGFTARSED